MTRRYAWAVNNRTKIQDLLFTQITETSYAWRSFCTNCIQSVFSVKVFTNKWELQRNLNVFTNEEGLWSSQTVSLKFSLGML
jgi:hypothetical protein